MVWPSDGIVSSEESCQSPERLPQTGQSSRGRDCRSRSPYQQSEQVICGVTAAICGGSWVYACHLHALQFIEIPLVLGHTIVLHSAEYDRGHVNERTHDPGHHACGMLPGFDEHSVKVVQIVVITRKHMEAHFSSAIGVQVHIARIRVQKSNIAASVDWFLSSSWIQRCLL